MPPPLQPPTLLHPNQVLTVKKAACWIQYLIDFYSYNIWVLPPFALDEDTLDGYVEKLQTVIGHASVLEQLLCRISFFLPDDVVQTVVAIVVTTHHQLSLIQDEQFDCIVVNNTLLENMSEYMAQVSAHLHAIHSWVQSGEYAQLSRAVDDALSGMRRSFSAFLAQMDDPPVMPPVTGSTSKESATHHKMSSSQISMDSLLNILSQHQFAHSSSLPEADRVMLERNFNPLTTSEDYPYQHPTFYACMKDSGYPSPSTTAYSGSPRPSRKGKERCLYEDDDSSYSTTISTSTTLANGPPGASFLSPVPPLSPSARSQLRAGVKRPRSRSESQPLSKRQRVSVPSYGVDGCLSDCSTHEATLAQVQPHVGHPVPLHPSLSPSTLPPPPTLWPSHSSIAGSRSVSAPADISFSSAGPSSSRSSASRSPSPPLSVGDGLAASTPYGGLSALPAPFRSTFSSPFGAVSLPSPHAAMDDWSLDSQGFTTALPDADTCSNASDSEFETASYVTAPDFAEDEIEMDVSVHSEEYNMLDSVSSVSMDVYVDANPSRVDTVPAKTPGTIKRRRCLEGLLQTIRQIFRAQT